MDSKKLNVILGLLFLFLFNIESQTLSSPTSLSDSTPSNSSIDFSKEFQYYVYDLSSPLNNAKISFTLSICDVTGQNKDSVYLDLRITSDSSALNDMSKWKVVSSKDTFDSLNGDIINKVDQEIYSDYYYGFRSYEIDSKRLTPGANKIYLAVKVENYAGEGKVSYQISGSLLGPMDKPLFDFPLSLLDTDRWSSSLIVNSELPDLEGYQIKYSEFNPERKYNTLCSIESSKSKTLVANKKNFESVITYAFHAPNRTDRKYYEAYIDNLKPGKKYMAWLIKPNSAYKTAGTVHPPVFFETKKEDLSCALARNLEFCNEVYYAVPIPVQKQGDGVSAKISELERKSMESKILLEYDTRAKNLFEKFKTVVDQYDCKSHVYSPVRNCADCLASYRTWLCAVNLPKISDSESQSLEPNSVISARGTNIDTKKWLQEFGDIEFSEIKPCYFVCTFVMQDCPTEFNFRCPSIKTSSAGYFHTNFGIKNLVKYELSNRNTKFSSNSTFPSNSPTFCNSLLYHLQIPSKQVFFGQGQVFSKGLVWNVLFISAFYVFIELFFF